MHVQDTLKLKKIVQMEKKRRDGEKVQAQILAKIGGMERTKEHKAKQLIFSKLVRGKVTTSDDIAGSVVSSSSLPIFFAPNIATRNLSVSVRPAEDIKFYCVISMSWLEAWKTFALAGKYEGNVPHSV